jgi:hypothetical protein
MHEAGQDILLGRADSLLPIELPSNGPMNK